MRYSPSLSRRCALLIVIISPVLLGSEFRCVAVSNPSVTTAHIDQLEPTAPQVGDVVQATASGNGTSPLEFAWDFGDGATLAAGRQVTHVYTAPGSYVITLTIRDALGHTARDSTQVNVSARRPPLMPTLALVTDAIAGEPVQIKAMTSAMDASALSFDWTFSDGQSATGPQTAAIFPMAGVYLASVTVSGDSGQVAVAEIAFEVVNRPRASLEQ